LPAQSVFPKVDNDAGHERFMAIIEKARAFTELLRKHGTRGSHLSVVGENGAA
jgi:hypothetical protein